jgi:hypothetical protein
MENSIRTACFFSSSRSIHSGIFAEKETISLPLQRRKLHRLRGKGIFFYFF